MNLPSDTPRLPKWIFLTGDAALLATAWIIYNETSRPFAGVPLVAFAACVVAAGVIGVIPFVSDYARRQDEALDERQRSLQALSVTVAASAEQIAIAATGLQGIAEAAQENLGKSEAVSKEINGRISELQALLSGSRKDGSDAAARLEAAAKAIASTAAGVESAASKATQSAHENQGKSEALSRQILEKVAELRELHEAAAKDGGDTVSKLEAVARKLSAAVAELGQAASRKAETAREAHPIPVVAPEVPPVPPSRIVEIKPAAAPSYSPFDEPAAQAPEAAPAAPPQAETPAPAPTPRKRSPRKPAAQAQAEPAAEAQPAEAAVQLSPPEVSEPAVSADGATRIVVTAYIGIGNRLFIRGDGPGLSWDKGVPLAFVSIGKWRWETNDASKAVRFRLYKNDEAECSGLGERSVDPGAQQELTAVF
jgi:uncharacterized protein YoxC